MTDQDQEKYYKRLAESYKYKYGKYKIKFEKEREEKEQIMLAGGFKLKKIFNKKKKPVRTTQVGLPPIRELAVATGPDIETKNLRSRMHELQKEIFKMADIINCCGNDLNNASRNEAVEQKARRFFNIQYQIFKSLSQDTNDLFEMIDSVSPLTDEKLTYGTIENYLNDYRQIIDLHFLNIESALEKMVRERGDMIKEYYILDQKLQEEFCQHDVAKDEVCINCKKSSDFVENDCVFLGLGQSITRLTLILGELEKMIVKQQQKKPIMLKDAVSIINSLSERAVEFTEYFNNLKRELNKNATFYTVVIQLGTERKDKGKVISTIDIDKTEMTAAVNELRRTMQTELQFDPKIAAIVDAKLQDVFNAVQKAKLKA